MNKILIISCVGLKDSSKEKIKAEDRYISTYFNLMKKYAKQNYNEWYILSAKYGLLKPFDLIDNYNISFYDKNSISKEDLIKTIPKHLFNQEIDVLLGSIYLEKLNGILKINNLFKEEPRTIGYKLQYLKQLLKRKGKSLFNY